ncbi:MAG: tetratricopeptide repeat protein [Planctomycetota bacterium]
MTHRRIPPGHHDPCEALQADIAALLDRKLEGGLVQRLLVHVEICPRCSSFMDSLRARMRLPREDPQREEAPAALSPDEITPDPFAAEDLFAGTDSSDDLEFRPSFFERMVAEGKERLAEIFFQLGRSYYLLSTNHSFFQSLTTELVPIPEYRLRGKAVLDSVDGSCKRGGRWVEARVILDGQLDSIESNLEKGRRLLEESMILRDPFPAALIYLGHYHCTKGNHDEARRTYRKLLAKTMGSAVDRTTKVPLKIYALEHLGTLCLDENRPHAAARYFRLVVRSDAMDRHPCFLSGYVNLAAACIDLGRSDEVCECLETVYRRLPDRREEVATVLATKLNHRIQEKPEIVQRLASSCPSWFGPGVKLLEHGSEVVFRLVYDDVSGSADHGDQLRDSVRAGDSSSIGLHGPKWGRSLDSGTATGEGA